MSEDRIWKVAQSVGFDDYELRPMLEAFAAALSKPVQSPQPAVPVVSDAGMNEAASVLGNELARKHAVYLTLGSVREMLASAILALRPAVEPMTPFTPSQRMRLWQNTEKGKSATSLGAFERICQAVEAAHRIGQESPQPAMPVVEAFAEGWKMAADWANRDDLLPDMDSPQYAKERDERLAELRPAVEPMTSEQRDAAIDAKLAEYGYPANTRNAARAGWYACLQALGITAKAEGGK